MSIFHKIPTNVKPREICQTLYMYSGIRFLDFSVIALTCGFYFCSCTPKPPGTSKVKKLLENLRESLTTQPTFAGA